MASSVRVGSKPSSAGISLIVRPLTPPVSLARANAMSIPSFMLRPLSFALPEYGMTIPKRISRSVTPCTLLGGSGWVGAVAALAAEGAIASASDGPAGAFDDAPDAPPSDCSRSATWRSATLQSIFPVVTALRPSAT